MHADQQDGNVVWVVVLVLGCVAIAALVAGGVYLCCKQQHGMRCPSVTPLPMSDRTPFIVARRHGTVDGDERLDSLSVRAGEPGRLPVPMGVPDDFARVMESTVVRAGDDVFRV